MEKIRFPVMMFDWGDTIMKDDPSQNTPMCEWQVVEAIEGAREVLQTIHPNRKIALATAAAVSNEADIRQALKRVELDGFFDYIFCFKNTGLKKPEAAFYLHACHQLGVRPSEVLMVGDNFENDVAAANRIGMFALWLNFRTTEIRTGEFHATIHSLREITTFLE